MSRRNDTGVRKLFAELRALVRSWWGVDRIRASPSDGRLLRLRPGSLMTVQGRPAEVAQRHILRTAAGTTVTYECRSAEGDARLEVFFTDDACLRRVSWTENGRTEVVEEADVTVFR